MVRRVGGLWRHSEGRRGGGGGNSSGGGDIVTGGSLWSRVEIGTVVAGIVPE